MRLPDERFDTFYDATVTLLDELNIPRGLSELGVAEAQIAEIARKAHTDAAITTNPVPATVAQIESLLQQALRAAR